MLYQLILVVLLLLIAYLGFGIYQRKNNKSENDSNSITSTNYKDYPAMEIIVTILDVLTVLVIFGGALSIFFVIISDDYGFGFIILLQILATAFAATLLKFSSETIKILCDIAFYLKSINNKTK